MVQEVSKRVAACEAQGQFVTAAIRLHGPEIIPAIEELFEAIGTSANVNDVLSSFGQVLQTHTTQLCEADVALAQESTDDEVVMTLRNKRVSRARGELIDITALVRGTYGEEMVGQLGLKGTTPQNPNLLANAAAKTLGLLRSLPAPQDPKPGRAPLDFESLAATLESAVVDLRASITAVRDEEKEYQLLLENRDAIFDSWYTTYSAVASIASALFSLGGRKDLAARVRPASRSRLGRAQEDIAEEAEAAEPTPPADPPAESPTDAPD